MKKIPDNAAGDAPGRVDLAIDPEIRLDGYPGPYGHVIVSLIENALIHGLHDRAQGRITVSGRQVGDFAEIEVGDDGWGIAAENLPQVFDPFFTTRFGQGGSGLGLNIVFKIVTGLLGGKISVDSPPGTARVSESRSRCAPQSAPTSRSTRAFRRRPAPSPACKKTVPTPLRHSPPPR